MSQDYSSQKLGLNEQEVNENLKIYGKNELDPPKTNTIWDIILNVLKEPMFILLFFTAFIYFFISKEIVEGLIMICSVILMMSIEVIQEYKTDKSLEKIRELSQPKTKVRRNGDIIEIDSTLIVPNDIMIITEGDKISADGIILEHSDLAVDESSLTGESDIIYKSITPDEESHFKRNYVYQGTNVILGSAEIKVTATGKNTITGKIGETILDAPVRPTPLEKQVRKLVNKFSIFALIMLIVIFSITFFTSKNLYKATISGITFAISTIPEEFPVILTIFLSLGAYRISKKHSLIRKLSSVETLGAISTLCVDKTGTLTENKMTVFEVICNEQFNNEQLKKLSVLACESNSYDPMEQAILKYCNLDTDKLFSNKLIHEYPFTSESKMMGHVWNIDNKITITAKGSPESILSICKITEKQKKEIELQQYNLSIKGLRVIAVATCEIDIEDNIPNNINDCELNFVGLISLFDPPRKQVYQSIDICNKAGIKVIMITGDNPSTAKSIGQNIGLPSTENIITGDQINKMSEEQLSVAVKSTNIFARVIPEQKMKIISALKKDGSIVAMTGDGVNDAPALKYADIGIAMGHRGTNVAKEASDMVLLDDNFTTIVETIKDGRRIYDNIRKAISYVLTFKIPIILASLLTPILGIPQLLLPVHVVLLELIIDPIAAIILERQPSEKNVMTKKPRDISKGIISISNMSKIIIQGIFIFLSTFLSYTILLNKTGNEYLSRSFSLSVLIISNIFLVYTCMSETRSAFEVFKTFLKDKITGSIIIAILLALISFIYIKPLNIVFKTQALTLSLFMLSILLSFISVIWYEFVKLIKNKTRC